MDMDNSINLELYASDPTYYFVIQFKALLGCNVSCFLSRRRLLKIQHFIVR